MGPNTVHPLNSSVKQGGFSQEKGGNLRDHDGCKANCAGVMATKHYDGDYGVKGRLIATPAPKGPSKPTRPIEDIIGIRG